MENVLQNLTKEDLIKVIANMHDTIQDWNCGYGLHNDDANVLIKVGDACVKECQKQSDWTLPK